MDMIPAGSREQGAGRYDSVLRAPCSMLFLVLLLAGCATAPKPVEIDPKFQAVAVDVYQNPESRSAASKILGVNTDEKPVVIKYSPVTGKHYSGDLEFDPETGARLEVIEQ